MGYYLLDRRNPFGDRFYTSRNQRLVAIVVHVTAGAEDLDTIADLSAENVAHYAATTDRQVSWHTGSDADSWVDLLPSSYTAWHASNYNSCTHGHEISKRHTDWRSMPATWVDKTLRMAALGPDGRSGLRKIALDNGIPLRWATRAEVDSARVTGKPCGFISHHEVQPADRTDPGYVYEAGRLVDTFPRARFMALLNGDDDDMSWTEKITISAPGDRNYTETHEARRVLGDGYFYASSAYQAARQVGAQIAGLSAAVSELAKLVGQQDGADAAEIEAAVAKAIKDNIVRVDIDVSGREDDEPTPTT